MKASDEKRIGKTMIAAQERIRRCMCRLGTAAAWHLAKAARLLEKPKLLDRIAPLVAGELAPQYLASLPAWIEQTTRQDARCAECWGNGDAAYPAQLQNLVSMLLRYEFSLRAYEKLARQTSTTLAETPATHAANLPAPNDIPPTSAMRMTEEDFGNLQQQIDGDLLVLDQARAELIAGHDELVVKLVQKDVEKTADPVANVTACARNALAKATENFDSRQGRRFATYAQWWIKTAIKEKKTWA